LPPFKVTYPADTSSKQLTVVPYKALYMGPYPEDKPKLNSVPFTPTQVAAIRSGINPGLTQVVGPPGTGKTDVAVQIMTNLYHNFPGQRTLIITHSNQALNDIFEKIMDRDVNEIHLLRLGRGEEDLDTDKDFSKFGRVNFMLERRIEHLAKVEKLGQSLGLKDDVSYTCETAERFFLFHIQKRWEVFQQALKEEDAAEKPSPDRAQRLFPFTLYFSDAPQPLFTEPPDAEEDKRICDGCFRHIQKIFTELEETRAFELLRTSRDRGNYLSMRQARIIAMTCTHAALKRRDLVKQCFQYDNLLMEETAQILEVETFIPMLLQNPDATTGKSRLKRVILIGDHHQLPPVVKNMAFQKYSHFDQSLFSRFVRLGIPTIDLNFQGRMRPDLAKLYSWKYKELGNLPHTTTRDDMINANPGLAHTTQFIDVPDFNGKGEFEPSPHFTQNLGEAEYCVALFMYMRLMGYPAEKISILATYRGQKHLIRDIIQSRCAWNPKFGSPNKVSTVDKFQGQQNDFVIISMVRTKTVGHIRDVRRLVVALSRARLGLYVFGRKSLFENCYELQPALGQLFAKPVKLQVVPQESQHTKRKANAKCKSVHDVEGVEHMGLLVHQMLEQSSQADGAQGEAMEVDK